MIFSVKKFTIWLLGAVFAMLIASSVQLTSAEQNIPIEGLFVSPGEVELVTTQGTNYQIYLQMILRNSDGQLINVTESTSNGAYIPHMISDHVFDTLMGEKEIVTIDNIQYEKVQYTYTPALENRFVLLYPIFSEISFELPISADDVTSMYSKTIDYTRWQIHYCATFKGHGDECIPVFQVLVPTMTLEPQDVVTKQWTILRELD